MPLRTPVLGGIQKGRAHLLPGALAVKAQDLPIHRSTTLDRTWLTRSIDFLGFPSKCALATHILGRRRIRRPKVLFRAGALLPNGPDAGFPLQAKTAHQPNVM